MLKIGVIVSSTRPNRFADTPTKWIVEKASARNNLDIEVLDLRDYSMPFFEEAMSPAWAPSQNPVALEWQKKIEEKDGFIVVTAEYNRGPTAVLKNALDYAYPQWNKKAIGFVGYGSTGAARAIEQLRTNAIELQMAPIRVGVHIQGQVFMSVLMGQAKLEDFDFLNPNVDDLLNQLTWWTAALKNAREADAAEKVAA
ncbi:MAG: NAD(P)H-dependent oxidoreductase [Bauldia sp.]|nr:NAD(P)H-dependent oxidoreductase [Bauldia sp.]